MPNGVTGGAAETRGSVEVFRDAEGLTPVPRHVPGEVGIWIFVAGDLVVFAVFFLVIALGQVEQAEVFARSRASLDMWVGVVNTLLLLTGSWFAAVGVEQCRATRKPVGSRYFSLAVLCGLAFVATRIFEWGGKIGIVLNRVIAAGRIHDNVYYSQGYSGHGVCGTHVMGEIIADAVGGTLERFDLFAGLKPVRIPGTRWLGNQIIALGMLYYRLRDRL